MSLHLTNDLISFEPSRCEVIQPIRMQSVAQSSKIWLWIPWCPLWHSKDRSPYSKPVLIGRSHGELSRFTQPLSSDEMRLGEVRRSDLN